MTKATKHTRALTGTAMLAAVATILMYMEFPIPIMPGFIKMDISELPALIASFAYGPLSGIAVCLIKNLIKLPSTSTAAVGELFNFVMGALFVGVAGIVYKKNKTRKGAIIGAVAGAMIMALVSLPYNYFVVYPAYVVMYHLPLEAIIGMYQAINPNVNGLLACLVTYKLRNVRFKGLAIAASLPPVLFNAVIIGIEIAVMFPDPTSSAPIWLACITNGISVGIGELISCTVLGVVLVKLIESNAALRKVFATE